MKEKITINKNENDGWSEFDGDFVSETDECFVMRDKETGKTLEIRKEAGLYRKSQDGKRIMVKGQKA